MAIEFHNFFIFILVAFLLQCIQSSHPAIVTSGIYVSDFDTQTTRFVQPLTTKTFNGAKREDATTLIKQLLQAKKEGDLSARQPLVVFAEEHNNQSLPVVMSAASIYMLQYAQKQQTSTSSSDTASVVVAVPARNSLENKNYYKIDGCESNSSLFYFEFDDEANDNSTRRPISTVDFHLLFSSNMKLDQDNQTQSGTISIDTSDFYLTCNGQQWASTRGIGRRSSEWLTFNVDKACIRPTSNFKNVVSICFRATNPRVEILDADKRQPNEQSFLVVKFAGDEERNSHQLDEVISSSELPFAPVLPFADSPEATGIRFVQRLFKRNAIGNRICHRETLHINFREFDLNLGILYPPSYSANYCSGECVFPLPRHLVATRHAQWQTMISKFGHFSASSKSPSNNAARPPPASCSPIRYSNKPVLITRPDGSVAQETFPDMTVEECGCL